MCQKLLIIISNNYRVFFIDGVPNDYQLLLAHFEWFLALFQISDVKLELLPVELKVSKNGIFWAKNLFQKNFS